MASKGCFVASKSIRPSDVLMESTVDSQKCCSFWNPIGFLAPQTVSSFSRMRSTTAGYRNRRAHAMDGRSKTLEMSSR